MTDREATPREEYQRRLTHHQERAAHAGRLEETISRARLGVALLAVVVAWLVLGSSQWSSWWLLAPGSAFAALVVVHARIRRRRSQSQRRGEFYRRGLARLDGRWAGTGQSGARFHDPHHPAADALDLFGEGSLYELLCAARTTMGEATLAAWLLAPSDPASARARQLAVQALAPRLNLREDLAVLGDEVAAAVRPDALASLATSAPNPPSARLRLGAAAVSVVTLSAVAAWAMGWAAAGFPIVALVIQSAIAARLREWVHSAEAAVAGHGSDLDLLAEVLERFERESFESPLLARLHAGLVSRGRRPSQAVRRLRLWVDLLDARRNQFFAPFAWLSMLRVHAALAVEAWRARHGTSVAGWLAAIGQLEGLCSLAGYAWEHPADVYPSIEDDGARFEAKDLGHPLIPETRCVRNDVALGGATRVLIVSGSNMSGKSTLLRAVGANTVLALAGAPVRASRLRLSQLHVGATLLIRDSLQEGTSRFYAELVRLRDVVRIAAGPVPLLFLLDEILHGTNSHDRRLGAAAVVRGLVQRGAIGLVTTHDLALSEVAEDPDVHAVNVHFEDRLEGGQMVFDYRIRPGVVRTSNALALMRTLGLWSEPSS